MRAFPTKISSQKEWLDNMLNDNMMNDLSKEDVVKMFLGDPIKPQMPTEETIGVSTVPCDHSSTDNVKDVTTEHWNIRHPRLNEDDMPVAETKDDIPAEETTSEPKAENPRSEATGMQQKAVAEEKPKTKKKSTKKKIGDGICIVLNVFGILEHPKYDKY